MLRQLRQDLQEQVNLSFCHSLDNKLAVMAKEKEAARTTCSFPCFENHFSVEFWTEAGVHLVKVFEVIRERLLESFHPEECYFDVLIYDEGILINRILVLDRLIHRSASLPLLNVLNFDSAELCDSIASFLVNADTRARF